MALTIGGSLSDFQGGVDAKFEEIKYDVAKLQQMIGIIEGRCRDILASTAEQHGDVGNLFMRLIERLDDVDHDIETAVASTMHIDHFIGG